MEWLPFIFLAWLSLLALGCVIEFVFYYYDRHLGKWTKVSPNLQILRKRNLAIIWIPSLLLLVLSLVFILSQISSTRNDPRRRLGLQSAVEDDSESINADIAGAGVRYAMLVQAAVLSLAVLMGYFHRDRAGVKELGIAILIFLTYLTFNLWYSYSDLVWIERLAVCMQIDALSAALSMTFSDKDTLASRWFIICAIICQCTAVSAIGYVISTLPVGPGPSRFHVFLIVTFENSKPVPRQFWLYFTLRVLNELHNCWLALSWTSFFNKAEHNCRGKIEEELRQAEQGSRKAEDPNAAISSLILHDFYASSPSTIFTKCIPQIVLSIVPLVAFEALVAQCSNVKGTHEWGQRAAIIPPVLGIFHWFYIQGSHILRVADIPPTLGILPWIFAKAHHIYSADWNLLSAIEFTRIVFKADQLRADAFLKNIFKSLLVEYSNLTTDNMIDKAISISDRLFEDSLKIEDINGVREAIHGGARLFEKSRDLSTPYHSVFLRGLQTNNLQIIEALLTPHRGDPGIEPIYLTPMVLVAELGLKGLTQRAHLIETEILDYLEGLLRSPGSCSEDQIRIIMLLEATFQALNLTLQPLAYAAYYGKKDLMKHLLAHDSQSVQNINMYSYSNNGTVLEIVQKHQQDGRVHWTREEYVEILNLLTEVGAKTRKESIYYRMSPESRVIRGPY